ncbi:S-norcoclaurine synthase 1-like [Rutidosis leptorrhynchoides]|uniref:S-norcoclaurine synthase 1-like n=1 Tax=Rutidosis leptorrhynchoides TaxID=125765 RepID=UPI003A99D857
MEESKIMRGDDFGGSLPVANVQALAANNSLGNIPLRYIRPEYEHDVVVDEDSDHQIPVIDMSKLVGAHEDELAKLHSACKYWGFFQLINHGVGEQVTDKMKQDIEEFFKLPLEEKISYAQLPNSVQGYGQAFVHSEEQKLDWNDMLFLIIQPIYHRNLRFWPTTPSSFRETLEQYSSGVQAVSKTLLRMMAKNLGLISDDNLLSMFKDGGQGIRMNYYPPCVQANKVIGLTPHSDANALTLLLQVNQVQGLQIKNDGKWIPVKPLPGAFTVNIGDIIEVAGNGEYKSIEHRAIVNPEKERLSIAAFHSPNYKAMIGPLPELLKNHIVGYKTMKTYEEYLRKSARSKLDGKNELEGFKL